MGYILDAIMILFREYNFVCATLYLMKLVTSDMIDNMEPDEFGDTTRQYTYMTRKQLFPKVGPVFMRRVYSVSSPPATETIKLNVTTVASVQNGTTISNVSEVPDTHNLSSITSSTLTTPIIYPTTIKDVVPPLATLSSNNSEIPIFVTPVKDSQYEEKQLNEILRQRLPEPNPALTFGTTTETYGTPTVTYGTSAVTFATSAVTYGSFAVPDGSPAIPYGDSTFVPLNPSLPEILRVQRPDPSVVTYGTTTVTYGNSISAVPYGSPVIPYPLPDILRVRRPDPSENNGTGFQDLGTDPFSLFLRKLLQVLSSKSLADLRKLIKPFEIYVTTLVDSGKLMKLGSAISSYIAQQTPLLRIPTDEIRRQLFVAQVSLEYRRKMLSADVNAMLDDLDDVYDASEEEAMQRVLREVTTFPNMSKNGEQIMTGFVDDIFLHPMHRIAGTTRGKLIFDNIAKIANTYNLPYDFARRFEDNKYEASKKDTNFDTDKYSERNKKESSSEREDRYHKITKTDKKFIIPISINQNLKGYSRIHRNKMLDKSEYEDDYGDSESEILNNVNGGIEIKIDIGNGRYPTAKTLNNKRKKYIENNQISRELDKKEDETSRKKLEPILNNVAYKRSFNKISTFHDFDSENENKRREIEKNQAKSGDVLTKNKFSIRRKKPATTTTNKDSLFFDYTDAKSDKKEKSLETKENIDLKSARRKANEKTVIEYDCKPLPVVNVNKNGKKNNTNAGEYSELLIFCDRASSVRN